MKYRESSEMRGIKVKEKVNYYIFGDEGTASQITVLYDKSTKTWSVKAGGKVIPKGIVTWWKDGSSYNYGETIVTFNDGDEVSYIIMEQHREVTPYVNYMYDIISTPSGSEIFGINGTEIRVKKDPDEIDSCIFYQYENDLIKAYKKWSATDVIEYKSRYARIFPENNLPKLFGSIRLDWHGMDPGPGFPQRSFQAIADNNYIYYGGENVPKGGTIKVWTPADYDEFTIQDDTNRHKVQKSSKVLSNINLVKRKGGSTLYTAALDRESIFHDDFYTHKDVFYNGKHHKAMYLVYDNPTVSGCWQKRYGSLCLTYAEPYWFLMASKDGIECNGTTYLARKLIKSWAKNTIVSINLKETTYKKKPLQNKDDKYDKIVYDIQSTLGSTTVTVAELINEEEKESRSFTPEDRSVKFGNILFQLAGNVWTIYSKGSHVKYSGRTYLNNKPILSFEIGEQMHIQIQDDFNKYEIKEVTNYTIKTPVESDISYEVHTSENRRTMKIVKTNNGVEEPWVTVDYYDALYKPYEFNDISLKFYNNDMSWELFSNNDNLFYNGTRYKKGDSIATWGYYQNIKFDNLSVYHSVSNLIQVQVRKSTTGKYITNNEIDLDFGYFDEEVPDFNVSFSSYNGYWVIKSLYNDIWCNGTNYPEGQIIRKFKTKTEVASFTIMSTHYDEEDPETPVNTAYAMSVDLDSLTGATSLTVASYGHSDITITDKNVSKGIQSDVMLTMDDADSMYGYIWQREDSPIPPIDQSLYIILALYKSNVGSAVTSIYANNTPKRIKVDHMFEVGEDPVALNGIFNKLLISGENYVFWSNASGSLPRYVITGYGYNVTRVVYYENGVSASRSGYGVLLENGEIVYADFSDPGKIVKGYYSVAFVHEVCQINITGKTTLSESGYGYGYFNNTYVMSSSSFVCIKFDEFNTNFKIGFKYSTGVLSPIEANSQELVDVNQELEQSGCNKFATGFDSASAIQVGTSIVMSTQVGKYYQQYQQIDNTYAGTVVAEYSFITNSMSYYNEYNTKQVYIFSYKYKNKQYLATRGFTWNYVDRSMPIPVIVIDGDLDLYLYEIDSVSDYFSLSNPSKVVERELEKDPILPQYNLITPTFEVNRIDSETPITIGELPASSYYVQDSVPVTPGPSYSEYSDKLVLHINGIIAVLDNPYWEYSANNFAWSLDNYGITNDYN